MSRTRLIALLLTMGTLAIYLPVSGYSYKEILKCAKISLSGSNEPFPSPSGYGFTLYDDPDYVSENSMVENGLTWAGIKWAFTTWHASNWHPVTWISHMLDCQFFGLDAGMHHVVNVLFHAANTILLFILLLRWLNFSSDKEEPETLDSFWPAAFVAALFAWHPLHVESVAWISERKDVLSTFFALLTLLSYTKYAKENYRRGFWFALIFFALALMSKPMFVTLPFLMLLLDYWPLERFKVQSSEFSVKTVSKLVVEKTPFLALVVISCVLTFLAQHHGGAVVSLKAIPMDYRFENAPVAVARYLLKMFWPSHLAVIYPLEKISPVVLVVSVAVIISISTAVWRVRKTHPYFLTGWLWFSGMLMPVIGIVQVGSASMADRYTYFPSIGIFLAVALGITDAIKRFQIQKIAAVIPAISVLAVCLFLTCRQFNYWRDDIALFGHAVAVTKNNTTAHLNLGYALLQTGRAAEAADEFRAVLKIDPDDAEAHNNLGNLLDDSGHPEQALIEFQKALQLNPDQVPAHNNLGTLFVEVGRFDDAAKQYDESIRLKPDDWHAPFLTGKLLLKEDRDAEAISYFQKALRLDPNNLHMLPYVAQVLASDKNPKIRDGKAAYLLAAKANTLSGGDQPAMLDALAMAYAELGRFADAQNAAQDAMTLSKAYGDTNGVTLIEQRLELYKKNLPFRQSFTNAPVKILPER